MGHQSDVELLDFINRTDDKSRCQQVLFLVRLGMDGYRKYLDGKRYRLKVLLEEEAQQFELEYENMIQIQIFHNITKNKGLLLVFKEQKQKEEKRFVELKQIEQNSRNCDQIRTNIRKQVDIETRKCQVAQIDEKIQKDCKEANEEPVWKEVARRVDTLNRQNQELEDCLKRQYMDETVRHLDSQVRANQKKVSEERLANQLFLKKKIMEDNRKLEEANRKKKPKDPHQQRDLIIQMQQRAEIRNEEKRFDMQFYESIENQKKMEHIDPHPAKMQLNASGKKYLAYAKDMKNSKKARNEENYKVIEDIKSRLDCGVLNVQQLNRGKIEAEARANNKMFLEKIYQNEDDERKAEFLKTQEEFVAKNLPMKYREPINKLEMFRKRRCELRTQIETLKALKAAEDEIYMKELQKIENDKESCFTASKKYVLENTDYLPPHPHLKFLRCSSAHVTPATDGSTKKP